jgi:serine/threonine protein kinase
VIGQTVSHYRIVEQLGRGGMGVVYIAEDTLLRRKVAIKFPSDAADIEQKRRFLREARHASQLEHPNVARIYDYGEAADGRPFFVMELVHGQSLRDLLKGGRPEWRKAVFIVERVLSALAEAHRLGIIHRDIKPGNVMVTHDGGVKVLDFGLAKTAVAAVSTASADATTSVMTVPGQRIGTPAYMAPEQAAGTAVDARADIFAAGALLFESLTGRRPFDGTARAAVPPPSELTPGLPRKLDKVVSRALAIEPGERYQSAMEMLEDLRPEALNAPKHARWSVQLLTRRSLLLALGALVITIGGLVSWKAWDSHEPSKQALRFYDEGLNALRDGTYARAVRSLQEAVTLDPEFRMARARLAEALAESEYLDRANAELLKVLGNPGRGYEAKFADALRLTLAREFAGAATRFQELADHASRLERLQALLDLGHSRERNLELSKALEAYKATFAMDPQYAAAPLRSGVVLGRLHKFEDAERSFSTAEKLYLALSNLEGVAEVNLQRAEMALTQNRVADGHAPAQKALEAARSTGNVYQQAAALTVQSGLANLGGKSAEAERLAQEAIDLARKNGFTGLAARGQLRLGNVVFVRGDSARAEGIYREGREYAHTQGLRFIEAEANFLVSSTFLARIQPAEALPGLEAARAFFEQAGYRRDVSRCVLQKARALRMEGRNEESLALAKTELENARQLADRALQAQAQDAIGQTLVELERFPEALPAYQESAALNREIGDVVGVGYAMMNAGKLLWYLGRYDEAERAASEVESIAGQPLRGVRGLFASATLLRAEMEGSRRLWAAAIQHAHKACELSESPNVPTCIRARMAEAKSLARTGHSSEALAVARVVAEDTASPSHGLHLFAQMCLAEVTLLAGHAEAVNSVASPLVDVFAGKRQLDSAWRTAALLAAARKKTKDPSAENARERAEQLLADYRKSWPERDFSVYMSRPDIVDLRSNLRSQTL